MPTVKGSPVYPTFGGVATGRLQRLETGAQRYQRTVLRPTSGAYTRLPVTGLVGAGRLQQKISLTNSGVQKKGSIPPNGNTYGFAYTSTATSITWYWNGTNGSTGIVIHRADGSNFTVPTAGSGFTVSGLTANTTYYFLPFWNTVQNSCNIGWVPGTTGTPQVAFVAADTSNVTTSSYYLIQQNLQGNEALSAGYMSAMTPASGSGGGGAGGHGCVMAGTEIETVGDQEYTTEVISETEWLYIRVEDNRFLKCTLDHRLYHAEKGKVMADSLSIGDLLITDTGEQEITEIYEFRQKCSKHKIEMGKGHLYWANGFLSHNQKPIPNV